MKRSNTIKKSLPVTCKAADNLPIEALTDFQDEIKKISKENLKKLKSRIIRRGINAPVFVWNNNGSHYLLDGHQRIKALLELKKEGYELPQIPVAYIDAKNKKDAKDALLGIASQYGDYVLEEIMDFTADLEIESDLRLVDSEILFEGFGKHEKGMHRFKRGG
ncbi:hypothetical protein ES705_26099 [subsurface metagenome]